jgi:hypothetical protein
MISCIGDDQFVYNRFVIQAIVHSINGNDMNDFSMIKKGHHYIKAQIAKDFYNVDGVRGRDITRRNITILKEVITIERFVKLAIKKKAVYLKKLKLKFPKDTLPT